MLSSAVPHRLVRSVARVLCSRYHRRHLSSRAPGVWRVDHPYTGDLYTEVPLHTDQQVSERLSNGVRAQRAWSTSSMSDRRALVAQLCDVLERHSDRVARDITGQMGKPLAQARGEVSTCIARARSLLDQSEAALRPRVISDASSGLIRRVTLEPVGVVLLLVPWNYPLLCAINSIVPALLAGNTVLVKHSDRTPLCSQLWTELLAECGAPTGLVQHLHIDHDSVGKLIQSPSIKYVQFTGSTSGGRAVYSTVGQHRFIDVGLELGGKDAAYVRADANLDYTVGNVLEGTLYNSGQSCCAIERVYVHQSVYDQFIERALAKVKDWSIGDPMVDGTSMGPLAQRGHGNKIVERIEAAKMQGAKVLHGGTIAGGNHGRFLGPTILTNVNHSMSIMTEESFAPVISVMKVRVDSEAVQLINDSQYGLTSSVWTESVDDYERIGAQLDTGTVYMNRCDYLDPLLPWSGRKDSGKGVGLSELGFQPFVRTKSWNARTKTK